MPGPVALTQLARIYGVPRADATAERITAALAADPGRLAEALFHEATTSDDVTSVAAGIAYAEDRLEFLADHVPPEVAEAVRAQFRERVQAWDA